MFVACHLFHNFCFSTSSHATTDNIYRGDDKPPLPRPRLLLELQSLPASQLALVSCLAVLVVPFFDQISGRRKAGVATVGAAVLACGGAAMLQSGGDFSISIFCSGEGERGGRCLPWGCGWPAVRQRFVSPWNLAGVCCDIFSKTGLRGDAHTTVRL